MPQTKKLGSKAFREKMTSFAEQQAKITWDAMSDVQRSHYMTLYYTNDVWSKLYPGTLPEDIGELDQLVVDGSKDKGLDFVYRSEGRVLFIQTKYRRRNAAESRGEVEDFRNVFLRLHPECRGSAKINQRVLDAISDIDWGEDTFEMIFISLGKKTDDINDIIEQGVQPISNIKELADLDERCDLIFLDESKLNEQLREAISIGDSIAEPVQLLFKDWMTYQSSNDRLSYVGVINAGQLRQLFDRYRHRLFNLNVRNYVGDTRTNKDIISTALNEPEHFYFYNNGITGVATHIKVDEKTRTLVCDDFSIINGAQTVRSLVKAHQKSPKPAGVADVLIRISEVSYKSKPEEQEFLENVTRFNNTQNSIKVSDFRSNDSVQRGLVHHFQGLSRAGKKYWYKNKRVGETRRNTIPISMEPFAKTVHAYLFGPVDVFGGTSYLFDTTKKGGYVKLFGDGEELYSDIDKQTFQKLAGAWFLSEQVDYALKTKKTEMLKRAEESSTEAQIIRNALERKWMVFFTIGELFREKCIGWKLSEDEFLVRFSKPQWLDKDVDSLRIVDDYVEVACELLINQYRADSAQDRFAHRNWFRSSKVLEDLASRVRDARFLLKKLDQP